MVSLGTARWMAPLSFGMDFGCQLYGMLSSPNMKQISDKYVAHFSPLPIMIAVFFGPQQIFQLYWLRKLWSKDATQDQIDYVPYYTLGNLCIAVWMIFWNNEMLHVSDIFVMINSLSQLYYVFARLPPMDAQNWPTHIVAKTFAGVGVLDALHNTSAAFFPGATATLPDYLLAGIGFTAGTLLSDGIFGACLVYDLLALYLGQTGNWQTFLGVAAVGNGLIVAIKSIVMYRR